MTRSADRRFGLIAALAIASGLAVIIPSLLALASALIAVAIEIA